MWELSQPHDAERLSESSDEVVSGLQVSWHLKRSRCCGTKRLPDTAGLRVDGLNCSNIRWDFERSHVIAVRNGSDVCNIDVLEGR